MPAGRLPRGRSQRTAASACEKIGVPATAILAFGQGMHIPHLHRTADTGDRLDCEVCGQTVEFAWSVVREIASALGRRRDRH